LGTSQITLQIQPNRAAQQKIINSKNNRASRSVNKSFPQSVPKIYARGARLPAGRWPPIALGLARGSSCASIQQAQNAPAQSQAGEHPLPTSNPHRDWEIAFGNPLTGCYECRP
jgi:hypothetical protein